MSLAGRSAQLVSSSWNLFCKVEANISCHPELVVRQEWGSPRALTRVFPQV